MKLAIVCAMDDEIRLLRERMENPESTERAGIRITTGTLCGAQVMLCLGGIGKANAAATAQYAICTFDPDRLVNIGLAGNCTGTLPLGGAVLADKLVYHDFDMKIAAEDPPRTEFYTPDPALAALAASVCEGLDIPFVRGTVATGDQFIQDEQVKNDIVARTGAAAVEMEGAAFAHICQKNGKPYLNIKIMSDNAGDGALDDFHASLSMADYCARSVSILAGIAAGLANG